ncbi:hypothetical protein [Novilysobacter erysipheiresistens]|uniref:Lipoprotein n=1 Tax=Novilysobacter erysipheiresistens TaxID=1749332 RepID=A0ABU7YZ71_9GAMM
MAKYALCVVALLLGGCATDMSRFNVEREAIFVVRVLPTDRQVTVFPGSVVDGEFKSSLFTPARFTGMPAAGYVVGKAKAGETIAITTLGNRWVCADGSTVVFQLDAGEVAYVGDVVYEPTEESFKVVEHEMQLEAAREFMGRWHPQWVGRLGPIEHQVLPAPPGECPTPGPTYIYIPVG